MGERTAIRFVSPHCECKSPWLYFHYYDEFSIVLAAVDFIDNLTPYNPSNGRSRHADHEVVGFIKEWEPERIFCEAEYTPENSGMDWGAWEVDTMTGVATAVDGGAYGVDRIAPGDRWDEEKMVLIPRQTVEETEAT